MYVVYLVNDSVSILTTGGQQTYFNYLLTLTSCQGACDKILIHDIRYELSK